MVDWTLQLSDAIVIAAETQSSILYLQFRLSCYICTHPSFFLVINLLVRKLVSHAECLQLINQKTQHEAELHIHAELKEKLAAKRGNGKCIASLMLDMTHELQALKEDFVNRSYIGKFYEWTSVTLMLSISLNNKESSLIALNLQRQTKYEGSYVQYTFIT